MKQLLHVSLFAAALAAGVSYAEPQSSETVTTGVFQIVEKDMTAIKFPEGSADLTANDRAAIVAMVDSVRGDATVDQFIVAAWSDKDYPALKSQALSKADQRLAEERLARIKTVLTEAGAKSIETDSMAEHPGWLATAFDTEQVKLKGGGKVSSDDDRIVVALGKQIRAKGGPSSAVIIVKHLPAELAH
jgi:hypothetical protein